MSTRYSSFDIEVPPDRNTPARKFRRFSNPIVSCLMCLFSVLNIIILFIILTTYSFTFDDTFSQLMPTINYFSQNLNSAPILSIQSTSPNLKCPSGFSLQTLTTWPGTVKGCYCPQRGTLYPGSCLNIDSQTCQTVSPVTAKDLSAWKGDAFCLKRSQNAVLKHYNETCSDGGYSDCGIYCVKEGELCPVTSVQVVSNSATYDPNKYTETVTLSQDRVLLISRDTASTPLYDLEISLYGLPCLEVSQFPAQESQIYPLLNIQGSDLGCGIYGTDQSSTSLEESTNAEVINSNNVTQAEGLPMFLQQEEASKSYFVSRQRIGIANTQECLGFDPNDLNILQDKIQNFKTWLISGTVVALFFMIVYWVYLMYLFVNEGLKMFYLNATRKLISWIVFTICFLVILSYNRYLAEQNNEITKQEEMFVNLGNSNCFGDAQVAKILTTFAEEIPLGTKNIMSNIRIMFWTSITFYVLAVFTLVYKKLYSWFCM